MKKIIVACGSGVATSQTVACKLENLCEKHNIQANVEAVDIKSLEMLIDQCDIYVSITPVIEGEYKVPTFSGIPFLTGIGMEAEFDKIVDELNR